MRRLLGVLAALLVESEALACSCVGGREVGELLTEAEGAFIGTVTSVKKGQRAHSYTFNVETPLKGALSQSVEVDTATNSALCGTTFAEGESYLVFLTKQEERYRTSLCSGNKPVSQLTSEERKVLSR